MTLEDFLGTITQDPNDALNLDPLQWREDVWEKAEEDGLAPGTRYAIIQRIVARDTQVFQAGGFIEGTTTSVRIYQKANPADPTPSRAALRGIYRVLLQAPGNVTQSPLGPLSGLTLTSSRLSVESNPDQPGGLRGMVTFTELIEQ